MIATARLIDEAQNDALKDSEIAMIDAGADSEIITCELERRRAN
jgi:hypothetical protein